MTYSEFRRAQLLRQKAELGQYVSDLLANRSIGEAARVAGISRPYLYDLLARAGIKAQPTARGRRGAWADQGL